jgi:hypothetical protein
MIKILQLNQDTKNVMLQIVHLHVLFTYRLPIFAYHLKYTQLI